jgi:hypothetical protein
MKEKPARTGYDMYFRASDKKTRKKSSARKRHAKAHTRRLHPSRVYNIPDEQMSEPPVVPKEERHYWH